MTLLSKKLLALNMSQSDLAKKLEMSQPYISSILNGRILKYNATKKIADTFGFNLMELIADFENIENSSNDNMVQEVAKNYKKEKKQQQPPYNTNVTAIPYEDYMEVEFVDLSVQAGPLGRHDVSELPKNRKMLVPREYDNGEYLVLKVDGNSMYKKDSDISIPAGTEILVKKYYLENGNQLPIRNNLFVIDAKDGQALKQIILHDVEKGFIRCHSYNEDYKDYDIRMEDVLQIFIYRKVISSRPPIPDF